MRSFPTLRLVRPAFVALLALAPAACVARPTPGAIAADTSAAPPPDSAPGRFLPIVRERFSGERALGTVAFVERFWRVPGNRGYDASLDRVAALLDSAGFVRAERPPAGVRLVYRVETRALDEPAWEPEDARLEIEGDPVPLLEFATNRNMLAINSYPTAARGVVAELVDAGRGTPAELDSVGVRGRIVLADADVGRLFRDAVQARGAVGVLAYRMPSYTRPEVNRTAIQFDDIPHDSVRRGWGVLLSYAARERLRAALARGVLAPPVRVRLTARTRVWRSADRVIVAEVRGARAPDERFVVSAHVDEPGANDDASGVAVAAEMARVLASLVRDGAAVPARTVTFLWGAEITATRRWLREDRSRTRGVKWGLSLDMVGQDTRVTGGTFLIEKMPDPSAIWTRGDERHSEWGGSPITKSQLRPHYFNDFVLARANEQARTSGWTVRTNPYEGGSDHVPFLDAKKPGLLFWHFTDVYYHTDNDRLPNVSPKELANVGVSALVSALTLASADGATARALVAELERAAVARLDAEAALSRAAVSGGGDRAKEKLILDTWTDWYRGAVRSTAEIEVGGPSTETRKAIDAAEKTVQRVGGERAARFR